MNSTLILFREIAVGAHELASRGAKVLENHDGDFFPLARPDFNFFAVFGPVELEKN